VIPAARRPSWKGAEGNEEEDRLELARPSKETNPRKETAEEKEGDREVPSCPTAGVTCTETAGDSRAGPTQHTFPASGCAEGLFE